MDRDKNILMHHWSCGYCNFIVNGGFLLSDLRLLGEGECLCCLLGDGEGDLIKDMRHDVSQLIAPFILTCVSGVSWVISQVRA